MPPYRISGAVFPKEIPNGPVFSGSIEIDGTKYNISLWEKQSKAGNSYLQISEDKRADKPAGGGSFGGKFKRPAPPIAPTGLNSPTRNSDMDDDIPF